MELKEMIEIWMKQVEIYLASENSEKEESEKTKND
jgi:hypothetical protein